MIRIEPGRLAPGAFALLFSIATLIVGPAVYGQGAAEADGTEDIEEIIVTGSYIKGVPEDAPLPVTTLTREDLAYDGTPTVLDLIKSLSFSQGADGETDQFQAGAGADRATINIRGLGPSRSLVLINGRRSTWSPHAISAQAQLLVDVNAIPSIAVERIEILRDGAAATYGSDAIAGVVNFKTRSDFTGFEVSGNHKVIDGSDGDTEAGLIFGTDFGDGRGHVVSSLSYIQRGELELVERDWAVRPFNDNPRGGWSSVGRPAVVFPLVGESRGPIVDPNCELLGGAANRAIGRCFFQYTAFDNLSEEAKRWQWFTEGTWELNEQTTFSANFLMADSDVPAWNTSPSYPPNRLADPSRSIRANNPGLIDMARKYPDLYGGYAWCPEDYCNYAGDSAAQDAASIPTAWQEVAWIFGRYYGQDGPLRDHPRETDLWRVDLALEGSAGAFDWTVSTVYSESERFSGGADTMVYRDARARQGLGGFECERTVPNEYDAQGNLSFSLETVMANAGQGPCRYWIPFSNSMPGSHPQVLNGVANNPDFNPALNNQDIYDYMLTELGGVGETSLLVVEGVLGGTLGFALPGGEVGFAAGAQWRSETYDTAPLDINNFDLFPCAAGPEIRDCTVNRNGLFNFLPPSTGIDQARDIYSLFGELQLPISDRLEGQLSLRYEDYGGATGASVDPKVALRWQVLQSVGVRASLGTTFRGPTLNQTVADDSSNSLQYVPATFAFKRIDTSGNPDLAPEEAVTVNVGLLIDRDSLLMNTDNLFVTIDYWSYDFEKPLVTEPFNAVLAAACPGARTAPCDMTSPYFERLTFGGNPVAAALEIVDVNIVNGPDIKTDGVDFLARYQLEVGPGMATFGLTGTRILGYDIDAWVLGSAYDALGDLNYGTSLARTLVEWKGRGYVNYAAGPLNLRYSANYVHEYTDGSTSIDSLLTHDVHAFIQPGDGNLVIWGSVLNAADEPPAFVPREMNYDAFTHNPFGRIVKLGVTFSFGS